MKRLIPIFILLCAAVAAGIYFYPRLTKKPAPANEITLSGNIEAHESLVGFKVQGRIIQLPVEEGQQVAQGAVIAQLEDVDLKQKVRIDEAAVEVRKDNLALTLAGTRQQEVRASQQAVIDAQADLNEKKLDNRRAEALYAKDEISTQDRDLAATALKRSEASLKAAQQRYNESVEGSRKEDIAIARANLNQADADLGLTRIDLSYTTLHAPSTGVITVRQAELGEVVSPGSPVVSLADLDHIWLRAYIAETDLGRIHWGQDESSPPTPIPASNIMRASRGSLRDAEVDAESVDGVQGAYECRSINSMQSISRTPTTSSSRACRPTRFSNLSRQAQPRNPLPPHRPAND